jgi:hypothetical protein
MITKFKIFESKVKWYKGGEFTPDGKNWEEEPIKEEEKDFIMKDGILCIVNNKSYKGDCDIQQVWRVDNRFDNPHPTRGLSSKAVCWCDYRPTAPGIRKATKEDIKMYLDKEKLEYINNYKYER